MNTTQWHANHEARAITEPFDFRFLSFELGLVKPDRQIFEVVASRLPVPRERVLFVDDNATNVAGAEASGFVARQVRGVDEARARAGRRGRTRRLRRDWWAGRACREPWRCEAEAGGRW